jgi:hypothetical protein
MVFADCFCYVFAEEEGCWRRWSVWFGVGCDVGGIFFVLDTKESG